jgi:hypothetical protein
MTSSAKTLCLVLPMVMLAACRDSSVASYRIPKEKDAPVSSHDHGSAPAGMPGAGGLSDLPVAGAEASSLAWTAPAPWTPKPASAMRKGSYTVGEEGGATADLSITAFPGDVGGEAANVNRWRGQVGLPELPDADVPAAVSRLKVGALDVGYVDLVNGPKRMLAAFVPYEGATWFFKLTGPDAVVAAAKPAYLEFLRSLRPGTNAPAAAVPAAPAPVTPPSDMAATPVARAEGPALKWTAPADWEARTPTATRKGSYTVKGPGDQAGDVAITAFPGDVGGELGNVNRWRGQLQLPPLTAAQLDGAVVRRQQGSLQVTIVDLTGGDAAQPARMIGAIVPFNGATWFFKLTGPAELVAREEQAFRNFLNTVQAP